MWSTPSKPSFMDDLIAALNATGATLAFDAIGGGKLASQILGAMEVALNLEGGRLQPLWLVHAQAGLHLRRPRALGADRASARAYGMALGRGRLAADAVPAEDRPGRGPEDCASASRPS